MSPIICILDPLVTTDPLKCSLYFNYFLSVLHFEYVSMAISSSSLIISSALSTMSLIPFSKFFISDLYFSLKVLLFFKYTFYFLSIMFISFLKSLSMFVIFIINYLKVPFLQIPSSLSCLVLFQSTDFSSGYDYNLLLLHLSHFSSFFNEWHCKCYIVECLGFDVSFYRVEICFYKAFMCLVDKNDPFKIYS